jgi:hypothetical protein
MAASWGRQLRLPASRVVRISRTTGPTTVRSAPYAGNSTRIGNDSFECCRLDPDFLVFSTLSERAPLSRFRYPLEFRLRWVRVNGLVF